MTPVDFQPHVVDPTRNMPVEGNPPLAGNAEGLAYCVATVLLMAVLIAGLVLL